VAKRKVLEVRVSAWRRAEAKRRGVDEQAVLPGHCAQDLVSVLAGADASLEPADLRAAIAGIPGLGARRMDRYGEAFVLLSAPSSEGQAALDPAASAVETSAPSDDDASIDRESSHSLT